MNKYISKGAKLMVYTSNLSTLETEVGGLPDQGQPRLQSKTVSQKKNRQRTSANIKVTNNHIKDVEYHLQHH
jgi:hypothetical protein